jgi:hypothetical protein
MIIGLRILHIVLGVYWAGTIFFFVTYLEPSLRAVGPDAGKVMAQLFTRRYLTILPLAAVLTVLAGLTLIWKVSNHFDPAWMRSGMGITLSIGGASAIIGLGLGIGVTRRAGVRMWAIMRQMPAVTSDTERAALMAEAGVLRVRSAVSSRWIAVLLVIAVCCMAIARYV